MAKDLFSRQSSLYAKYRPDYPPALFSSILDHVTERNRAWDCATGNGQAAFVLADYFEEVIASDLSAKQLAVARQHPRIRYTACKAEQTPFSDNLFDLVTVAQAYHWFDFDAFRQEAQRVSKPGAIIAIWGYGLVSAGDNAIDSRLFRFYKDTVGAYWDAERKYVDDHYESIPFPFPLIATERFSISVEWSPDDLEGYLNTWSAVQHYIAVNNINPVTLFRKELDDCWQANESKRMSFPLFLKLGRIIK